MANEFRVEIIFVFSKKSNVALTKSNVASTLLPVRTGFNRLASAKAIALIVRSNYIQDVFITRNSEIRLQCGCRLSLLILTNYYYIW